MYIGYYTNLFLKAGTQSYIIEKLFSTVSLTICCAGRWAWIRCPINTPWNTALGDWPMFFMFRNAKYYDLYWNTPQKDWILQVIIQSRGKPKDISQFGLYSIAQNHEPSRTCAISHWATRGQWLLLGTTTFLCLQGSFTSKPSSEPVFSSFTLTGKNYIEGYHRGEGRGGRQWGKRYRE